VRKKNKKKQKLYDIMNIKLIIAENGYWERLIVDGEIIMEGHLVWIKVV
jgi:hypothetical protein